MSGIKLIHVHGNEALHLCGKSAIDSKIISIKHDEFSCITGGPILPCVINYVISLYKFYIENH